MRLFSAEYLYVNWTKNENPCFSDYGSFRRHSQLDLNTSKTIRVNNEHLYKQFQTANDNKITKSAND